MFLNPSLVPLAEILTPEMLREVCSFPLLIQIFTSVDVSGRSMSRIDIEPTLSQIRYILTFPDSVITILGIVHGSSL